MDDTKDRESLVDELTREVGRVSRGEKIYRIIGAPDAALMREDVGAGWAALRSGDVEHIALALALLRKRWPPGLPDDEEMARWTTQ